MPNNSEISIKLVGGIKDQCWTKDNVFQWVDEVINDLKKDYKSEIINSMISEIIEIQSQWPLDSEYESDARYTWPKRWEKMLAVLNKNKGS